MLSSDCQILVDAASAGVQSSFPSANYPKVFVDRIENLCQREGINGREFVGMGKVGEAAVRSYLSETLLEILPGHLLSGSVLETLEDVVIKSLDEGNGYTIDGVPKASFFFAVVGATSGNIDDRWSSELTQDCFVGVLDAISSAAKALAVVSGPPESETEKDQRCDCASQPQPPRSSLRIPPSLRPRQFILQVSFQLSMAHASSDAHLASIPQKVRTAIARRLKSRAVKALHPLPSVTVADWDTHTLDQARRQSLTHLGHGVYKTSITAVVHAKVQAAAVLPADIDPGETLIAALSTPATISAIARSARHICTDACSLASGDDEEVTAAFFLLIGVVLVTRKYGRRVLRTWLDYAVGEVVDGGVKAMATAEKKKEKKRSAPEAEESRPTKRVKQTRNGRFVDVTNRVTVVSQANTVVSRGYKRADENRATGRTTPATAPPTASTTASLYTRLYWTKVPWPRMVMNGHP
ncbi:hypothetical protein B0H16DRAFT_1888930 [Mycena metata]|uniref:Uncharacterized protein n=1 Tax=Mycena metata TaxID=1033252 RepID=A0AAD7N5Z1_9AGAR|nr:hypothetical protein B0H16DRAFT_1888930 [Mycena metata]